MQRLVILLVALAALASNMVSCGSARTGKTTPTPESSPTPPPLPTPLPEIRALRTVCLSADQSYPEIDEEFSLPIAETAEQLLRGAGLQVAGDTAPCDGSLAITLTGTPLGKDYVNVGLTGKGTSYCYTGAAIEGKLAVAVADRAVLTLPFDLTHAPRSGTITSCPGKSKAPFGALWPQALIENLTIAFGPQIAVQALAHEDASVRQAAFQRLRTIGPEADAALTQALEDNVSRVRVEAASVLQQRGIHTAEITAALIQALEDGDPEVRAAAAFALGGSPPTEEVTRRLIAALKDEAAAVREAAAGAFRQMGPQEGAVPALVAVLGRDEDADVREAAAYTLGKMGAREGVVAALIRALADEDEWVRGAAATALGDIGPEEGVVPALIEALSDVSRNVRSSVARELEEMTGKDFGQDAARWLEWWQKQK